MKHIKRSGLLYVLNTGYKKGPYDTPAKRDGFKKMMNKYLYNPRKNPFDIIFARYQSNPKF